MNEHTPAAHWREKGEPDPHSSYNNLERAALALGDLTDDELANAVFLYGDTQPSIAEVIAGTAKMPIVYLTAGKERIRWLSRKLIEAEQQHAAMLSAQADHQRLVRELDVLLNGEAGAARQASLCDLVAQVAKDGVVAKTRFDGLLEAMHGIAGTLDELSQEDAVSSLKGGAAGIASGIRKSIIKIMGAAPAAKDNV